MERATRNSDPKNSVPNILDYLDYRQFLKDRMAAMATQHARYSQRWFAKQAGFHSLQLIPMILKGTRNLSRDKVPALGEAMRLNALEVEYFEVLVDLAEAGNSEAQSRILQKIKASFHNGLFSKIDDNAMEIFRHWYLPALRELVSLKYFSEDPKWIAKVLGISAVEAQEGLELLLSAGFLRREDDRILRSEPSVHSFGKHAPVIMGKFHMQVLERSFQALKLPRESRYFEALTFAIPKELFPQLREIAKRFVREVDVLVESHTNRSDVCQMNIQLFKVAEAPCES